MNTPRQYAALFLVFHCVRAFATDGEYYRLFQAAVSNELKAITSPLLVDTNNTGFKLTNVLLHLKALKPNGQPSGIRLGMTMEQVVAQWGKPYQIEPRSCLGGPCFFYTEVRVHFEATSNSVQAIRADVPDLARALHVWPTVEECIRKVGKPSRRTDYTREKCCSLLYVRSDGRMRLTCNYGTLTSIDWGYDPGR